MKRSRTVALQATLGLVWVALLMVACAGAASSTQMPANTPEGTAPVNTPTPAVSVSAAELLSTRCTRCHTLDRITQARKTQAEWQSTVERMQARGAQLNAAEKEAVVRYLAQTYGR